jgi:hypothetical protein
MTPEEEISYALGVAQGNVPAYADAMGRRFWVQRALSLMTASQKKRLSKNEWYGEVKKTLEKLQAVIEEWVDAEAAEGRARLAVEDLASEAGRMQDMLDRR